MALRKAVKLRRIGDQHRAYFHEQKQQLPLHVGLHKTGTSFLQMLSHNFARFSQAGMIIQGIEVKDGIKQL